MDMAQLYYIPGTGLGGKPMRSGLVLAPGKVTDLGKDAEQGHGLCLSRGEWRGGLSLKDGIFLKT